MNSSDALIIYAILICVSRAILYRIWVARDKRRKSVGFNRPLPR